MALLLVSTSPYLLQQCHEHSHDCFEVILNLTGSGTEKIGEREYPFEPGSVHIVPPGLVHRKYSEEGFIDIYLHIDSLPFMRKDDGPIAIADDYEGSLTSLAKLMLAHYPTIWQENPVMDHLFEAFLLLLTERISDQTPDPAAEQLKTMIRRSFPDPEFSVTDALLSTGYSKDYVRRRFIASVGMPPAKYLTDLRINYAKQMLEQERFLQLSIAEIALRCGYYDAKYFSRIFKQQTGKTPGQWKKSMPDCAAAGKLYSLNR